MCIKTTDLAIGYGKKTVASGINIDLAPGSVMAVLGANGSGKTTLIRTLCGLIQPISGKVDVEGCDICMLERKRIGRLIAYVPQNHNCTFTFSVRDIAVMGRNPFLKGYCEPAKYDYDIVDEILSSLKIEHLAGRKFTHLSGGEKKLVLIARALVQQPKVLIMDEPTSDLDIKNTVTVLERITKLKKDNMSIIINTHSPKEAKVYADKILMIKNGGVYRSGEVEILNDTEALNGLYSLDTDMLEEELSRFVRSIA